MTSKNLLIKSHEMDCHKFIGYLIKLQDSTDVHMVRKEGEVLYMIKQEPMQPVKYYMNKSGMSARWFNEILKQLIAAELVAQETCSIDSRRKLLS
jgi:hypothetical protein